MVRRLQTSRVLQLLAVASLLVSVEVTAATPLTIAVQGRLMTAAGGAVTDGTYPVVFRLYSGEFAKAPAWSEAVAKLTVKGGVFHHRLGSIQALTMATLEFAKSGWLAVQIGNEPELARNPIHSVPFALRASVAESVSCTGCVAIAALKSDGDLKLTDRAIKAKLVTALELKAGTVQAQALVGNGSKLTGLILPPHKCPSGQHAIGVAQSGQVFCAAASAAGGGSLEQASGGLLTTAYAQPVASQNTPKPISDNNPIGTVDEIDVPDIGPAKSLTVSIKLNNSDLSHLEVYLYDPNKVLYVLHKGKPGKLLDATYPTPDKPVSGDLSTWIGKNPKGKWRVRIIDTKFLNNKDDGELTSWQVNVQAAKSNQVTAKGAFVAAGGFYAPTSAGPPFPCKASAAGQLYFDLKDKHLYYCDGDWRKLLPEAICGNGVINPGEQCDDGNTNNGDGCTALCLKNVCGDGILHKGVEACEDGNKVSGDGCSAACKLESKTFKGYANWSQNVNNQTDAQQDAMMDQVCKKYGPTVVAATIDEIINHPKKIKNMPSKNGSGQHLLGKCPNCAGNKSGGKSGHCRKCVNPNLAWPKALNSGWNTNCCTSTRSALCLL